MIPQISVGPDAGEERLLRLRDELGDGPQRIDGGHGEGDEFVQPADTHSGKRRDRPEPVGKLEAVEHLEDEGEEERHERGQQQVAIL